MKKITLLKYKDGDKEFYTTDSEFGPSWTCDIEPEEIEAFVVERKSDDINIMIEEADEEVKELRNKIDKLCDSVIGNIKTIAGLCK